MNLEKKRVLVTGAGGFIGSHLCEALLKAGAEVTAMIKYSSRSDWGNLEFLPFELKKELKVVAGNIEDGEFVHQQVKNHHIVFHLAALIGIPYSYIAPLSYIRTNIEGTLNVMEATRTHNVSRVIHTSTSEVYGTAIYIPIDENHPLKAQSPYSASKIGADKVVESYYLSFGLPVTTVRPFNTYGPRQSARAIIPTLITQALSGTTVKIGNADPKRDFTYIDDTVRGFIKIAENESVYGATINLGTGSSISVRDLSLKIFDLLGKPNTKLFIDEQRLRPEQSEVLNLLSNNSLAREKCDWVPKVPLEEGLIRTIEFIKKNMQYYRSDQYSL